MSIRDSTAPDVGYLHVASQGQAWVFPPSRNVLIGRDPRCDINLADERVSREHLELHAGPDGWVMADLSSLNGTWINGSAQSRALLKPDADIVVRVGDLDGPEVFLRCETTEAPAITGRTIVIGRDLGCDVVVDDPLASRRHAVIEDGPQAVLRDLDSFNGTYRNGQRITGSVAVQDGDQIGVGNQTLLWSHREVTKTPLRRSSLDARHLTVTTAAGAVLLDDVSVNLPAGSVTAVIGPSGAGKSTLMGALTGLRPARQGQVTWNGRDLYEDYDQLRFLVGLVPQEDILHRQLTVYRALRFAARLRLPPDTTRTEREARIDEVLSEVKLGPQKHQRIDSLSGGQLKRTSIALELLTAPQLLFLDEPTSGLDPGLDRQVMAELRALADAGRVVVVVTHSVLALDVCDRVLLLASGGRVAFFGPPAKLLPFFGVQDYPAAFEVLKDPAWVQRYAQSPTRAAFIGRTGMAENPVPAGETPTPSRPAPLRQLWALVQRNLAVAAADRMLLVLLVTMPVILALMAHAFPGEAGLSMRASDGQPGRRNSGCLCWSSVQRSWARHCRCGSW